MYAKGSCSGLNGPGNWSVVLIYGDYIKECSGFVPETTAERIKMYSSIEGLRLLKTNCHVLMYSNSEKLVDTLKNCTDKRSLNPLNDYDRDGDENQDLWRVWMMLAKNHSIECRMMEADDRDKWNLRCDELVSGEVQFRAG